MKPVVAVCTCSISSILALMGMPGAIADAANPTETIESSRLHKQNSSTDPNSEEPRLQEAHQLFQQVQELSAAGKYREATPLAEQVLELRQQVLGNKHPLVAKSLIRLGELYRFQGLYDQAEPLFQQALDSQEQRLGSEHPDLATSLIQLGVLYRQQGRFAESETFFERSLTIIQTALGAEHRANAGILNNLGDLYQEQGRYQEAGSAYQRALSIRENSLGPDHPHVANILTNLADLYRVQGNYDQAEPLFERALHIREQGLPNKHPDIATSLNNLAALYRHQGRYPEAEPLYERALALRQEILPPSHPMVGNSLRNLANLYRLWGDYQQSEAFFLQALEIFEQTFGAEHPEVAQSFYNLANFYRTQNDNVKALSFYQKALTSWEILLGTEHPDVAITLADLSDVYRKQQNYPLAEQSIQRALTIQKDVFGTENRVYAESLSHLAKLRQAQGSFAEAEQLYQEVLSIRNQVLPAQHPDIANAFISLASVHYVQGKVNQTIDALHHSLDIQEANLQLNLTIQTEQQKQAYLRQLTDNTNRIISLHLQTAPNNPQAARLAFTTLLQRKGRIFDVLSQSQQGLRQNLTPADQALLDNINETRTRLAGLLYQRQKPLEDIQGAISSLQQDLQAQEKNLARRSDEFRSTITPVTIEAVQDQLPNDTVLVEFFRYIPLKLDSPSNQQNGNPRYAAYLLDSQGNLQAVDIGEAAEIDKLVAKVIRGILRNRPINMTKRLAHELEQQLIGPLRPFLRNNKKIRISPDGQLNLLPFEVLVDEQQRYLVETYEFTYLSAGRELLQRQDNITASRKPSVLIANPDYEATNLAAADRVSNHSDNRSSKLMANLRFAPLPGTAEEAEEITKRFPEFQLFTQSQATEEIVKQLESPWVLHLATHGFFFPNVCSVERPEFSDLNLRCPTVNKNTLTSIRTIENPLLRSGLALAGVNSPQAEGEDGILTALEVSGLDLKDTEMVVLSACETGLGDIANGEGVYGLRRAFALAGSKSQLISLWQVDDIATKDLMVNYYRLLEQGNGRSEALRQIQLAMIKGDLRQAGDESELGVYSHPFYWAAFILSGEGGTIDLTQ
ncbi:MAG: tetratricopeptide repeat protein [Cyanobacteria bacterium P01_H01_bin.105]